MGKVQGLHGFWTQFTPRNSPLPDNSVTIGLASNREELIWVSTGVLESPARPHGLFLTDGNNWLYYELGKHGLPIDYTYNMVVDSNNHLWFSTPENGICCFDGQETKRYTSGLSSRFVWITDIFVDPFDRIWLATMGNGVYRLSDNRWEKVGHQGNNELTETIYTFGTDTNSNLWLACEASGEARFFVKIADHWQYVCSLQLRTSDAVRCLIVDKSGTLWVGLDAGGLMIWDGQSWHRFSEQDSPQLYGDIPDLVIDEFDNLWVNTATGIAIFDGENWHDWKALQPDLAHPPASVKDWPYASYGHEHGYISIGGTPAIDNKGRKWLSASNGLVVFTPETKSD